MTIEIQVEEITTFHNKREWINKAQSRIGGFRLDQKILCVDKNGNILTIGLDFMVAEDHDLYPVKAYRCIRTNEINERKEKK